MKLLPILLLTTLYLLLYTILPTKAYALETGLQIASDATINRFVKSQESRYGWIKYQFSLGSDQPLARWIEGAKNAKNGSYKVLISVAKNVAGIPVLKSADGGTAQSEGDGNAAKTEVSNQYCWYPDELRDIITYDQYGREVSRRKEYTPGNNGYQQFMQKMEQLAPRLQGVDAVEVWNEPNLLFEWTEQKLGELSPKNYAVFLECGIKGLRKGGYTGTTISAALAPLSGDYDDKRYFNEFVAEGGLQGPRYTGTYEVNAIGWHSNVLKDIPPTDSSDEGFQRVRFVLDRGKPVWITEFGWDRSTSKIDRPTQSEYVADAFSLVSSDPDFSKIQGMFVFNFGFFQDAKTFEFWDIEGVETEKCEPSEGHDPAGYPDTRYFIAPTTQNDDDITDVSWKALIPKAFRDRITFREQTKVQTAEPVKINVYRAFLPTIVGDLFTTIVCFASPNTDYCSPTIALGKPEIPTQNKITGIGTEVLADKSEVLGKTESIPGMTRVPHKIDCNFTKKTELSLGNEQVSTISTHLAKSFYGAELPDLPGMKECLKFRENTENLSVSRKLASQDQRVPGVDCEYDLLTKSKFPPKITPFPEKSVASPTPQP